LPHQPTGERRVAQRGRPHDDASGTRPEARIYGTFVAEAARYLDPRTLPHPGNDRSHQIDLPRTRIARAVEVDDVQPAGAAPDERVRDRRPILGVGRHRPEVTPEQPDDATALEVDRGQELERAGRRPVAPHLVV
jgi:hypothetical protein